MQNIIIPICGKGTRVRDKYNIPKPLIEINGKPIIQHSIESLGIEPAQYIFIIRRFLEYPEKDYTKILKKLLLDLKPSSMIIEIGHVPEGPACSALLAKDFINNDDPLIITNCDQKLSWNPIEFLNYLKNTNCDGCVTTYPHNNIVLNQSSPFSFIELNKDAWGTRLEEKFAISNHALNGIHFWKHGKDFISSAQEMIKANDRVNNEFYISKSYNYMINKDKKINIFAMKKDEFDPLGSVEEIENYLNK